MYRHRSMGVVPVALLYKTDMDATDVRSFRPIFNLSVISKLMERLVARRLLKCLTANNLLPIVEKKRFLFFLFFYVFSFKNICIFIFKIACTCISNCCTEEQFNSEGRQQGNWQFAYAHSPNEQC